MGGKATKSQQRPADVSIPLLGWQQQHQPSYCGGVDRRLPNSKRSAQNQGGYQQEQRGGRGNQPHHNQRRQQQQQQQQQQHQQPQSTASTSHTIKSNGTKTSAACSSSHHHRRPWTPASRSPHSTDFTVSTDNSAAETRSYGRHRDPSSSSDSSSYSSSSWSDEFPQAHTNTHSTMAHEYSNNRYHQPPPSLGLPKDRRVVEAEKILEEIAKEFAAKRAAGLVPTKPVPARTLLWEELATKRSQAGRRGQCIFGRDSDKICGCTSYKKKRIPGQENTGGVCDCCNHGSAWHQLVGGNMARTSSRMTRSIIGSSSMRASRLESQTPNQTPNQNRSSLGPSEARSSMYDYDSDDYDEDDDDDDDEDDEAIANEMAMPSTHYPPPQMFNMPPPPPYMAMAPPVPQFGLTDRSSLLSMGSSYGFPSRLSSGTNSLGALLQAIQRYRDMGMEEDEIEARIREDFPPVPRKSSLAARSDISQSQVDI